jgi:hypothetical protein
MYTIYRQRREQAQKVQGRVEGVVATLLIINMAAVALWAWGTFGTPDIWAKPQCTFSEPRGF